MPDILPIYFEALERLKKGRPAVVPKGTKINNDAVALEAGRGKGSIKKSRPIFKDLIEAIDTAAAEQARPQVEVKERFDLAKGSADRYRGLWEEALAREVSLVRELYSVKMELKALTGSSVIPIRGKAANKT